MIPREGERFRSRHDVEVWGLITFRFPASGGFRAVLAAGEIVVVLHDPPKGAKAAYALPARYKALENVLVPAAELHDRYESYVLGIRFEQFDVDFERAGDQSAVTRYWFTFEGLDGPSALNLGCGVTAIHYRDALKLLGEKVFPSRRTPDIASVVEDVDVSTLDPKHVVPNMEEPASRGVWFPRGYR